MKHLLRLFALTAVLAMLAAPSADAQRHNGAGKKETTEQRRQRDNRRDNPTTRPGRGSKPSGGKDSYRKPSMPSQHPGVGQRPDNDKRPGGSPSHQRPDNRPDNDKYHPGRATVTDRAAITVPLQTTVIDRVTVTGQAREPYTVRLTAMVTGLR